MLILNMHANVICMMLKSNVIGFSSPKLWLYDSHQSQLTFDASSPSKPPTTKPDKIKINNKEKMNENEKINYINNSYKATLVNDILKIYIPETLPKFKNISNYAYKNIIEEETDRERKRLLLDDKKIISSILIELKQRITTKQLS